MKYNEKNNELRIEKTPDGITPEEAAKLPGMRILKVGENKYNIQFSVGFRAEEITRMSLTAMILAAQNPNWRQAVAGELARSMNGCLRQMGIRSNAEDVNDNLRKTIESQKEHIARLEGALKALGGNPEDYREDDDVWQTDGDNEKM